MILKLQSSQRLVSSSRPHCHVAGKAPGPEVEAASRHEALTGEFEARRLGEGMGEDCLHLVTSFLETRNFEMARTVAELDWDILFSELYTLANMRQKERFMS